MAKTFITTLTTTKKHTLFIGKNALWQALFFDKNGRLATPTELYKSRPRLKSAVSWKEGVTKATTSGTVVEGCGVHAKMYELPTGSVVISSQNNGTSPLFETAVLYQGKGSKMDRVRNLVRSATASAKQYSKWWKDNKGWLHNG